MTDERIAAIMLANEPEFILGVARVRPATREYLSPRGTETLEPRVMKVLVVLAQSANSVVSRHELTMAAWEGVIVGEDAINRVMSRLRRLSDADAGRAFVIKTIVKVGYALWPAASRLTPEGGDATQSPEPVTVSSPPLPSASDRWFRGTSSRLIGGVALLGAAGVTTWVWSPRAVSADPMPLGRPIALAARIEAGSSDAAKQLSSTFRDVMAVDLTQAGLTVAADDAPARVNGSTGPTFRVATTLAPDATKYTLTARVEYLPSHAVLWSRRWQSDLSMLARHRDEIALRLSDMLALVYDLRGQGDSFVAASLPDLFAGAGSYRYQAEWPEALRHWKSLANANPRKASAWGVAARAAGGIFLTWDWQHLPLAEKVRMQTQARQFAERALAIDSRTDQAYAALSDIAPRQDLFEREAILQRGLAAMGGEDKILDQYLAVLFCDTGYWRLAAPYAERALKTDPNSRENIFFAALVRMENGDPDADISLLNDTIKRWPDDTDVWGFLLEQQHELGRMAAFKAMLASAPQDALSHTERDCLEAVLAVQQPGGAMPARLDQIERCFKQAHLATGFVFDAMQRAGAGARAFALMTWAAETKRCETICLVGHSPGIGFRQQPGYWPLVDRIGLVRYWRRRHRAPDFCSEAGSIAACARAGLRT